MPLAILIARTSTVTPMMESVSSYFVVLLLNQCANLAGHLISFTAMTGKQVLFRTGCIPFTAMIHSLLIQRQFILSITLLTRVFSATAYWKWPVLPQVDFSIPRLSNLPMLLILWGVASFLLML